MVDLQRLFNYSPYQWARLLDLASYDQGYRNNSFANPFFRQRGDENRWDSFSPWQSNVHQGRNQNSRNYGRINERGNNNLVQHGAENAGFGSGRSFFNWQGAGDQSSNYSQSNADKFINWQRGNFNISDGSQSKRSDIWQGGYDANTRNIAIGGSEASRIKQVAGRAGFNAADANGGASTIDQRGGYATQNIARGSDQNDNITQSTDYGRNTVNAGAGDDNITLNGNHNQNNIDAGDGNDTITLNGNNNTGTLNGGAGDDRFYINGQDNNMTLDGGTGNNSAYFNGNANDYNINRADNGQWTLTSRSNPNSTMTLNNMNDLYFRGSDGNYQRYEHPSTVQSEAA